MLAGRAGVNMRIRDTNKTAKFWFKRAEHDHLRRDQKRAPPVNAQPYSPVHARRAPYSLLSERHPRTAFVRTFRQVAAGDRL